jgi:hypothetical protein
VRYTSVETSCGAHRTSESTMARLTRTLSNAGLGLLGWWGRYFGWLLLTTTITLGGGLVLMLFKDLTLGSVFTAMLAWPVLGFAALIAIPIAFLPLGRLYVYSAVAGGALYNLILLLS